MRLQGHEISKRLQPAGMQLIELEERAAALEAVAARDDETIVSLRQYRPKTFIEPSVINRASGQLTKRREFVGVEQPGGFKFPEVDEIRVAGVAGKKLKY